MKTTIIFMLLGALAGVFGAAWVVPPALAWYTAPGGLPQGGQIQAVVQIPEVIRYATDKLIRWQTISACVGGAAGLVVGMMMRGRRRQPPGPSTQPDSSISQP
jgi:hypothetical protein